MDKKLSAKATNKKHTLGYYILLGSLLVIILAIVVDYILISMYTKKLYTARAPEASTPTPGPTIAIPTLVPFTPAAGYEYSFKPPKPPFYTVFNGEIKKTNGKYMVTLDDAPIFIMQPEGGNPDEPLPDAQFGIVFKKNGSVIKTGKIDAVTYETHGDLSTVNSHEQGTFVADFGNISDMPDEYEILHNKTVIFSKKALQSFPSIYLVHQDYQNHRLTIQWDYKPKNTPLFFEAYISTNGFTKNTQTEHNGILYSSINYMGHNNSMSPDNYMVFDTHNLIINTDKLNNSLYGDSITVAVYASDGVQTQYVYSKTFPY